MSEPSAPQMVAAIADSMVDVAVRGGMLDTELNRRVAMTIEKEGVVYEVTLETMDAEELWERSLPVEEQIGLILHKLGHHTDMIQILGQQGGQTHALLHRVADKVGADAHS